MSIQKQRLDQQAYAANFSDIRPPFETKDAALVDANRCLYCYDAPCTKSCPTHIDIPKFIKQITTDNVRGSARTILSANIMGAGCSRVCPVEKLCEGACVYNLMEEPPIPIARLQRYSTDKAMQEKWPLFERKPSSSKKVAIVGAGPAGLSCAHILSREGIDVEIFEKEAKGGGLMTYGIAAYKVTPEFCDDEVDYILSLGGISIHYEKILGQNISLAELQNQYDAVFLAYGLGLAKQLDIPGEELNGVVDALQFIYSIRSEGYAAVPVGDKVAVIGMGMTAIDAATQAKRLGAKEVTLLYRRTQAEMPCTEKELNLALLDGCQVQWLTAPISIKGSNGNARALECQRMRLGEAGPDGRRSPIPTGDTYMLEVDMVIKAAGQQAFESILIEAGIDHQKGRITTTSSGLTNIYGVFAGGDCVNGGKEVVDAVEAGKKAAQAILDHLNSKIDNHG